MKKFTKFLQTILILLLLSIFFIYPSFAEDNSIDINAKVKYSDLYEEWLELPEEERAKKEMPSMFDTPYVEEEKAFKPMFRSVYSEVLNMTTSVSTSYNLKNSQTLTVKDQGYTGECWAFSTTSIIESTYQKLCHRVLTDLSPRHIDYSTTHQFSDGNKTTNTFIRDIGSGGNFALFALSYLTSGKGPIYESEMPAVVNTKEQTIKKSQVPTSTPKVRIKDTVQFASVYKDKNGGTINYYSGYNAQDMSKVGKLTEDQVKQNRTNMKNHIMQYGALTATTAGNFKDSSRNVSFYNSTYKAFYCDDIDFLKSSEYGGHAITIVGWDDNFSKTKFATQPVHDGAWIVLNSYGTYGKAAYPAVTQSYGSGYDGYYYISYDDVLIESAAQGITNLSDIDYDNLYQQDELGSAGYGVQSASGTKAKIVYTRKTNKEEKLKEIGIRSFEEQNVSVAYIAGETGNEETLVSNQRIHIGYNTIKIPNPKSITTNTYSIVVTFNSLNGTDSVFLACETAVDKLMAPVIDGKSYIYNTQYNIYQNISNGDLCIKAYTTNTGTTTIEPSSINLTKTTLNLKVGNTEQLNYTISPNNANSKTSVSWSTSNSGVATVSNGLVRAVSAGTAVITVTTANNKTSKCTVYCSNVNNDVPVISVSLNKNSTTIYTGKTETLRATIQPLNATNQTLTWTSSNTGAVRVQNGVITGVAPGVSTVTVKSNNNKSASCTVTCIQSEIPVTSVTLNKSTTTIYLGKSESLTATVLPTNASNKTLTWTSSNANAATVTNAGVVIARNVGETTITARTQNGVTGKCIVYVKENPSIPKSITPKESSINMYEGNTKDFSATVIPTTASQDVLWKSNDESIVSVTSTGQIRGIKPGNTSIKISSKIKESVSVTVPVTVVAKSITDISIKQNPTKLNYIQNLDNLDLAGGKILVKYSNNTQEEIDMTSNRVKASGFDNTKSGKQTIYITYSEYPSKTLSFEIDVAKKDITEIKLGTAPSKRVYVSKVDDLDLSDGTFICEYNDKTEKEVKMTDAKLVDYGVEGIDSGFFKEVLAADGEKQENQEILDVVLQYENRTITVKYSIELKTIQDVTLNKAPNKTTYYLNEPLDLKGGEILVTYTDGKTQIVKMTDKSCKATEFENTTTGEKQLAVQYYKPVIFKVNVTDKESEVISKIGVSTPPTKNEYLKNVDDLKLDGGQIKVTYKDGAVETKSMTDSEVHVSGFNKGVLGTRDLTVEYKGTETTFPVDIVDEYDIEKIEITPPTKTVYTYGKDTSLNLEGGKVTVKYKNGAAPDKEIEMNSEEVNVTGFDDKMLGEQTITVTYKDVSATFTINMTREISKISISKPINKIEYTIGETALDLTGGELLIEYTDGYRDTVPMTDKEVTTSGFNGNELGMHKITVKYREFTTEFNVVVSKAISSIKFKTEPTKKEYIQYLDTEIDISGAKLIVIYSDSTTGEIDLTSNNCTVSGFDNTKVGEQEISINYRGYTLKYKIRVISGDQKIVDRIRISSLPTKRRYIINKEELDLSGGKIEIVYNDSSVEEIEMSDNRIVVTGYDKSVKGNQTITVNYQNKLASFNVTVVEEGDVDIAVSSISMKELPTKTNYKLGENLSLSGGSIKVTYSDGTSEDVPLTDKEVEVSGFDNTKTGTQTLKVSYKGKECTFDVSVSEGSSNPGKTVLSIRVSKLPEKTVYQKGEELDLEGGVIEVTYTDSTKSNIDMTDSEVTTSGFNSDKAGIQMISVRYENKIATFSVTVKDGDSGDDDGNGEEQNSDIRSITISKMPEKTTYEKGDELDLEGGEITATHTDGSKETVSLTDSKVSVDGFNTFKVGVQSLTIKYEGAETTLAVKVVDKDEEEESEENQGKAENENSEETKENKRESVNTGDNIMTYFMLLIASVGIIIASSIKIYVNDKKKKEDKSKV